MSECLYGGEFYLDINIIGVFRNVFNQKMEMTVKN